MSSDCPDRVCVKSGRIKRPGEFAACVPNRFLIVIEGTAESSKGEDVDLVAVNVEHPYRCDGSRVLPVMLATALALGLLEGNVAAFAGARSAPVRSRQRCRHGDAGFLSDLSRLFLSHF